MERSASGASLATSNGGGPRCRLCWSDDTDTSPFISPCNCRGSVGFIHVHCLQHWLEVKRQQGASRKRSVRCEVCRAKYKTAQLPAGAPQSQGLLLPRIWSDPYAIAAVLHGAWRAYVVTSGLWRAWSLYRSINASAALQQQALCAHAPGSSSSSGGRFRGGGGGTTRSGVRIGVAAPLPPTAREPQPLRHHLSLSVPLRGGVTRQQQLQQGGGGGVPGGSSSKAVLDTIRERFDKATMVQVYWYTALMGLTPMPPNVNAFEGMACGATIGGVIAQLVFLPMLNASKVAALYHSSRLLLRCLVRLLAAEACQARGYRLLAGLIRSVMQRWSARRARRLEQQRAREQQQQQHVDEAGGGDADAAAARA